MSDSSKVKLTPREERFLRLLSDGQCHSFANVLRDMGYSDDEQASVFTLVSTLRRLLKPHGQTIVWEMSGQGLAGYRHVVLMSPAFSVLKSG